LYSFFFAFLEGERSDDGVAAGGDGGGDDDDDDDTREARGRSWKRRLVNALEGS
jgi:hypothetical protein